MNYWQRVCVGPRSNYTTGDARTWARELIELENTDAIVTPVEIEFLCGARNSHEMQLFEAFLGEFVQVDGGDIRREDWEEARKKARRVPRDSKPRQMADCLIKAIADRLHCEVRTGDRGMPR